MRTLGWTWRAALPSVLGMATLLNASGAAFGQASTPAPAQASGRITGVGGVFVRSKDPKALTAWYRDVLGVRIEAFGAALLHYDAPGQPPLVVWRAFKPDTKYMEPSTREFMIDFTVDDMDAFLTRLTAKGVPILKRDDASGNGRFAWIVDPDGTKIELWEPEKKK